MKIVQFLWVLHSVSFFLLFIFFLSIYISLSVSFFRFDIFVLLIIILIIIIIIINGQPNHNHSITATLYVNIRVSQKKYFMSMSVSCDYNIFNDNMGGYYSTLFTDPYKILCLQLKFFVIICFLCVLSYNVALFTDLTDSYGSLIIGFFLVCVFL